MRTRPFPTRAAGSVAVVALALLAACSSTPPAPPQPTIVDGYIAAVSVVEDPAAEVTLIAGALDGGDSGGPVLVVGESATVVNGGSIQQTVSSDRPFESLRVAVEERQASDASALPTSSGDPGFGYWQVNLSREMTDATIVISVPQDLPGQSFVAHFAAVDGTGVQGERRPQVVEVAVVGTGDVQVSVSWDVDSDLDLHVAEPGGAEIYWDSPSSPTGGVLDLDSNPGCAIDSGRSENVTWPAGLAPPGDYEIRVDLWDACGVTPTNFVVTLVVVGQVTRTYTGTIDGPGDGGGAGSGQVIASFAVPAVLPSGEPQQPEPVQPEPVQPEPDDSESPTARAHGFDDPSRLSDLRTMFEVAPTAVQWAVVAAGALMLMLVVGWPSTLLNAVVGSRYASIARRVTTRYPKLSALERQVQLPGWLMWPGFAIAALLGAFVDPEFGLNAMSLRLVVTLFVSFVLFNLVTWAIVRAVARRLQPESDPRLRFRWKSLLVVVIGVLAARLLGFEPGVIFGLVAGVAYAATLQAAKSAIVTIVGSAVGLGLAIAAWFGYSLLAPTGGDGDFAMVFLVEFLAGVTVKGVSTLPLSLLPLGNLDGAKLLGWKRSVWGASYAVGLAASCSCC
jgi:hypothetical protein